jgi:hypothetical protein
MRITTHSNDKLQVPSVLPQQNHFKQDSATRSDGSYISGYFYGRNFGTEMKKSGQCWSQGCNIDIASYKKIVA